MHRLGFSTGALTKGDFRLALKWLEASCVDAIELSALRESELPGLVSAIQSGLELRRFQYRSVHAPTDSRNESGLIAKLQPLADQGFTIIVHPDGIHSPAAWRALNGALCIENMDSRKSTGRTVEELAFVFRELPEAGFCFDIGHARQVDPTMIEALAMVQEFKDRLRQVHLSEVDSVGAHHPLTWSSIEAFRPVFAEIADRIPVILESTVDEQGVSAELAEARLLLNPDSVTRP